LIRSRLLTISDGADHLQMSGSFVVSEIRMDNLEVIYIGYAGASKLVGFLDCISKTLSPL